MLYTWFNIFGFIVCMSGPKILWSTNLRVYATITLQDTSRMGQIIVWTNPEGGGNICINGRCLLDRSNRLLCNPTFDIDDDGDIDLQDWALTMSNIILCDSGRCLTVKLRSIP